MKGWPALDGSDTLGRLDIPPTVACIIAKTDAEKTVRNQQWGRLQWRLSAFYQIGHNSKTVRSEPENYCTSNTIPSDYRTAGRPAMANPPGVSPPTFAFIPAARRNPGASLPDRSLGKSPYQMMPKISSCGSTTQTNQDASAGTAGTVITIG